MYDGVSAQHRDDTGFRIEPHTVAGANVFRPHTGINDGRQTVFPRDHCAVGNRTSDVGNETGDQAEIRGPAHISDWRDQDFTGLDPVFQPCLLYTSPSPRDS